MKRLIWLPLVGFLLIAGAAVAAASPGLVEKAADLVNGADGPTPSSSPSPSLEDTDDSGEGGNADSEADGKGRGFGFHVEIGGPGEILDEVLDGLVADGTLTQEQADAVTDGLTQALEDKRAEIEAQAEQMQQTWEQIKSFLEDGVITSDELAQLPEDNPISNLEDILADGQITQEELDSVLVRPHSLHGPGGPGKGHFHVDRFPGGPPPEDVQPDDPGTDTSSNS